MDKVLRTAVTAAAIAIAAQLLTLSAQAGPRSAVGVGLIGFGIGAILGTMMGRLRSISSRRPPTTTDLWSMGCPIMMVQWPTAPLTLTGRGATDRRDRTGLGTMARHRQLIAPALAPIQVPRRRLPATKSGAPRRRVQQRQRRGQPWPPGQAGSERQVQGRAGKGKARRRRTTHPKGHRGSELRANQTAQRILAPAPLAAPACTVLSGVPFTTPGDRH